MLADNIREGRQRGRFGWDGEQHSYQAYTHERV
jgi:hypothetical protein